ncbi:MAG: peptidoglycan-binding protein [Myxococcota bacterium]|nr:peptidoglycan-binding protein [Myxococcota bacterium]
MSSYSQQERRESTGSSTTSTSNAEHDDLQDTLGNSAIQEMLSQSGVPHDSAYHKVYQNHVNKDANINISLSETQMRNVTTFQEHWQRHQARYVAVAAKTDIPPKLIAALHWRESTGNFNTYLHQGDPLGKKAVNWPNNIPIFHKWEDAAVHALNMKKYTRNELNIDKDTREGPALATYAEAYNGLGYHNRGRQSPYVYAGSSPYTSGKYVADGKFSRTAVDQQVGVLPLLGSVDGADSQSDLTPRQMSETDAWNKVQNGDVLLREGMNSVYVRALQSHLKDLGYNVSVDGDFGPGTMRAVQEFQRDQGLAADGVVGAQTAAQIDLAQQTSATSGIAMN